MYNYTFKTILNKKETDGKKQKGAKIFEIQLLKDFLDEDFDVIKAFENFEKNDCDVKTIHSPLDLSIDNGTIYLEHITCNFFKDLFFKTCLFAHLFAEYYNHPVNVIIHNGFRFKNYIMIPSLTEEIIKIMNNIIDKFPDIYIEIENTVPMSIEYSDKPYFNSGVLFDNIEIVNFLNEKCKKSIFKTVIDVCHYLTTIEVFKRITNENYTLEDFFKEHQNVIGTIHLANLKGLGINEGEHGCYYSESKEDISLLKEVLFLIDKYAKDADICLEISEKDYFKCPDLFTTVELIEKIKKGII